MSFPCGAIIMTQVLSTYKCAKGLLRINRIKRIIKLKSDKRHYFGQTALFKLNHFWHECQNLINLI